MLLGDKVEHTRESAQGYSYIHKSIYEFYVQQSFMQEVNGCNNKQQAQIIDIDRTNLGTAYLSNDLDILRSIGKDLQHVENRVKEETIFPCMHNSILLSRTDKSEKTKTMSSNMITVLNCCDHFQFYKVDFKDCEFPRAILSKAILEEVNFENCNLEGA